MSQIVCAGIVTYNPELNRLKDNIEAILPQVDYVIIFDNASKEQKKIINEFSDKVIIITSQRNLGIAAALNYLMKKSEELGAVWMISLDQDSVCPPNFYSMMFPYLSMKENFGIVVPVIIDRNIGIVGHNPKNSYKSVKTCITSGAFTRINVWREIGGYDESMFIDSVDFEFCYRIRKAGYQIVQVKNVQLLHKLGNCEKKQFLFWKVRVNGHSAFRKYYIARNTVYYPLKHKLWLRFLRGNIRNVNLLCIILLFERDKRKKCKAVIKGWLDGIIGRKIT